MVARGLPAALSARSAEHIAETEHLAEQVAQIHRRRVEAAARRAGNTRMAVRIVRRPFLRIGKNTVGFGRFFEFLLGRGIARVAIGMVLQSQLTVGALEFLIAHATADGQNFVIVAFNRRHRDPLLVKSSEFLSPYGARQVQPHAPSRGAEACL